MPKSSLCADGVARLEQAKPGSFSAVEINRSGSASSSLKRRIQQICGSELENGGLRRFAAFLAVSHLYINGFGWGKGRDWLAQAVTCLLLVPVAHALSRSIFSASRIRNTRWIRDSARASAEAAGAFAKGMGSRIVGDKVLLAALALAFLFNLHGWQWGQAECWNPDQMAFRSLGHFGMPHGYSKPPLLTFITHALILFPLGALESTCRIFHIPVSGFDYARLFAARLLVNGLYLATILFVYETARMFYGRIPARCVALVMATSAGFIVSNHFLTCDSALLMPMTGAFYFSARIQRNGSLRDYIWAGILTGLAFNMKYNGLAVGIAIPLAHMLSSCRAELPRWEASRRLLAALFLVPLAAIASDPFMVLDYHAFKSDFLYNYAVTPTFGGGDSSPGYLPFLMQLKEIFGIPGAIIIAALIAISLIMVVSKRRASSELHGFLLASGVFLLYYGKFGSFHRAEMRFTLPMGPFLLLMCGPALLLIRSPRLRRSLSVLAVPLLIYSCICSYCVGARFKDDPRMGAFSWMKANLSKGPYLVESSPESPNWYRAGVLHVKDVYASSWRGERPHGESIDIRMPDLESSAKNEAFMKLYSDDPAVVSKMSGEVRGDADKRFYAKEALEIRRPDIITWVDASWDSPPLSLQLYYRNLMDGDSPYQVVYDESSPTPPAWLYPTTILFVERNRAVIFKRKDADMRASLTSPTSTHTTANLCSTL